MSFNFNFEWFDKRVGAPVVSIAKYGLLFSRGAVLKMGNPEYVMLGFDKSDMLIGIKVCDVNEEMKTEFASKERNGYVRINNKQFIKYIESSLDEDKKFDKTAIQYMGKWYDDQKLLVIDLKKPMNEDDSESDNEEE